MKKSPLHQYGIPEEAVKPLRDKFIAELSKEISKQAMSHVTEKEQKKENNEEKKDENRGS